MRAGKLDRRVTFLKRTRVQNAESGAYTHTYADHVTVWGGVRDVLPSRGEDAEDGLMVLERPTRLQVRHRKDLDSTMRVRIRGEEYRIISGPAEIRRNNRMEFLCELLTTEGDEP